MNLMNIALGDLASLDKPVKNDSDSCLGEFLADADYSFDYVGIDLLLKESLISIDYKLAKLLIEGKTQIKAAKILGISQANIHRRLKRIRENLRDVKEYIA